MKHLFRTRVSIGLRLALCIFISVILLLLDHRMKMMEPVRSVLSAAITPIEYLVDIPIQFKRWLVTNVSTYQSLREENINLRANVVLLKGRLQKLEALEMENSQLRALLLSSPKVQGRILVGQVLAVNSEPFLHQVMINKGRQDGLFLGQPVLDANGVVGEVVWIGLYHSRVLLITDNRVAVPVEDSRNDLRGIVSGRGDGSLELRYVAKTMNIQAGDILMTSGLGQRFPAGYPVGKIISIDRDPGNTFAKVRVGSKADINKLQQVLLVWPNAKTVAELDKKPHAEVIKARDN